jgi:hypothetical protein
MGPVTSQGILLPVSVLHSPLFAVLATFVAINTLMYLALAIATIMPKVYVSDLWQRHGRRDQTRSIHPDGLGPPILPAGTTP